MNQGVVKIILAVLVIGVVGMMLYRKQSQRPVPVEADRWAHPGGFSIVVPQDWFVEMDLDPRPGIRLYPKEQVGPQVSLFVFRYDSADHIRSDGVTWEETTFQDQPAREFEREEGSRIGWRMVFQRGDHWYQISAVTPPSEPASSGWLRQFIETFRVDTATTRPTTLNVIVPQ